MCLGVPMRVVEVTGSTALVEQEGISRKVRIDLLPQVRPGDYVIVHAGLAIERVKPDQAEQTLNWLRALGE